MFVTRSRYLIAATQQDGLDALNDPMKGSEIESLVLSIRQEYRFTHQEEALIVNFIATSSFLEELEIGLDECSSNNFNYGRALHHVRKCVLAAARNPKIFAISLHADLTNTTIGKVNDVLTIGAEKAKKVSFVHCSDELEIEEMELINATVASLPNLESIGLTLPREEYFLDLLTRLSRRENPTLRNLELKYSQHDGRQYTTTLPGIDSFLRSVCGRSLTDITIILGESTTAMWQRLVSGLTHNKSICSFSLETRQVPPSEGIDLLANYLRHSSTLTKLRIGNEADDVYFQDSILSALCSNTCLRELLLERGFFKLREGQGVSVSHLLIRNSHLELLDCEFGEGPNALITNSWIASTSKGLERNSTLRTLIISNWGSRMSNIASIFDAVSSQSSRSGLEDLQLYGLDLTRGCAQVIASAIVKRNFGLKDLTLWNHQQEGEFLNIVSAVAQSTSLRHLSMCTSSPFCANSWKRIASILPNLALISLHFDIDCEEPEPEAVAGRLDQELLKGMRLNKSLEGVALGRDGPSFQSTLNQYCNRNLSCKAVSAMMSGRLSPSSLPHMLRALHSRCETKEEYVKLASTVVFSTLRSQCPVVHLKTTYGRAAECS